MGSKRRHERYIRRLELEFSASGKSYRAISSDFSCNGLFIRTNHAFAPGALIQINIYLPDGMTTVLSGVVRRAIKTPTVSLKNGMGIEIVHSDDNFKRFMAAIDAGCSGGAFAAERSAGDGSRKPEMRVPPKPSADEFLIIACSDCGVKNKLRISNASLNPKCGRCGVALHIISAAPGGV